MSTFGLQELKQLAESFISKQTLLILKSLENFNTHPLIWKSILKLKDLGCDSVDMGEQNFTSDKAGGISRFKAGFGGQAKVRLLCANTL